MFLIQFHHLPVNRKSLLTICLGVILIFPGLVVAQAKLVANEVQGEYYLGEYLLYLRDKEAKLSIEDILQNQDLEFKQSYTEVVNLGLNSDVHWFKGSISFSNLSVTEKAKRRVFEINNAMLADVDLYFIEGEEVIEHRSRSKVRSPHSDSHKLGEAATHRNFIFYFEDTGKEEISFVLRVKPVIKMLLPFKLWNIDNFIESENLALYSLGLYFGLMIAMALYLSCLYFIIKETSYFYFIAFILSNSVFFLALSGLGYELVWPMFPEINNYAPVLAPTISLVVLLLFTDSFFQLKTFSSRLHQLCIATAAVFIAAILNLFVAFDIGIYVVSFVSMFSILVILYITYRFSVIYSEAAKFFLPSIIILAVSAGIYLAGIYNVMPSNVVTMYSPYFGSAIQTILLALGLANKLNSERKERYTALLREHKAVQDLRDYEESALEKAMIDPLTKLPNRARLQSLALEMSSDVIRKNLPVSVMVIQLRGIHEVNHTLGLQNGDLVLERMAKRLNGVVNTFQNCVEIGQVDESPQYVAAVDNTSFAIFFNMREEKEKYIEYGNHLIGLVNRPLEFHGMSLDIIACGGMAFCPEHSTNITTLVRFAQIAAESGEGTKNMLEVYSAALDNYTSKKLVILGDLRKSLNDFQLELYFQPQIDIARNAVIGVEALTRWNHPEFDFIPPSDFIPLAEKTGIIHQLTDWLLDQAFGVAAEMLENGIPLRMSVNVSVRNILEKDFVNKVVNCLERYKLSYSNVIIEVTETAMMNEPEKALAVLKELNDKGISIAIDDYGSGFSSLSYIKQLPLSEIKIDREFISNIDSNHNDRIITKTTISMSHSMGFSVCAEGVESEASLKILSSYGCDIAQGYYIAKPMNKDDLIDWLDKTEFLINNPDSATA